MANVGRAFIGILLNASTIKKGSCNKRKKFVRSFIPKRNFKATNTRREAISVAASPHYAVRDPTLKWRKLHAVSSSGKDRKYHGEEGPNSEERMS